MAETTIKIDRESFCMADDVMPHEEHIEFVEKEHFSDFLVKVWAYLPKFPNSVWSIRNKDAAIAFIYTKEDSDKPFYRLEWNDLMVQDIPDRELYCAFFKDVCNYPENCRPKPIFPDIPELIDQVQVYEALRPHIDKVTSLAKDLKLAKSKLWDTAVRERAKAGKSGDITALVNEIAKGQYDGVYSFSLDNRTAVWKIWSI